MPRSTLGSHSVRVHIAEADKVKPDADRAAESLRQIADHGEAKTLSFISRTTTW